MTFKLKKNEQILVDRAVNLFRGIESVGGRLKITNQRLIFEPHAFNIQKQTLEVPLNQIREIQERNTMGIIPNGILIKLVSGQEYKFVIWKRAELIELIKRSVEQSHKISVEDVEDEEKSENVKLIEKEIERLEKMSDSELILYILGVIGLFFFIIPGIIFFIIAGRISSSRKTHIASLRAQLVMLEQQSKRTEYPRSKRKEDKCPYCKTKLNPDDDFCPKCGRKV